jgi:hypothetical protein
MLPSTSTPPSLERAKSDAVSTIERRLDYIDSLQRRKPIDPKDVTARTVKGLERTIFEQGVFISRQDRRIQKLEKENTDLRRKVEELNGMVRSLKTEFEKRSSSLMSGDARLALIASDTGIVFESGGLSGSLLSITSKDSTDVLSCSTSSFDSDRYLSLSKIEQLCSEVERMDRSNITELERQIEEKLPKFRVTLERILEQLIGSESEKIPFREFRQPHLYYMIMNGTFIKRVLQNFRALVSHLPDLADEYSLIERRFAPILTRESFIDRMIVPILDRILALHTDLCEIVYPKAQVINRRIEEENLLRKPIYEYVDTLRYIDPRSLERRHYPSLEGLYPEEIFGLTQEYYEEGIERRREQLEERAKEHIKESSSIDISKPFSYMIAEDSPPAHRIMFPNKTRMIDEAPFLIGEEGQKSYALYPLLIEEAKFDRKFIILERLGIGYCGVTYIPSILTRAEGVQVVVRRYFIFVSTIEKPTQYILRKEVVDLTSKLSRSFVSILEKAHKRRFGVVAPNYFPVEMARVIENLEADHWKEEPISPLNLDRLGALSKKQIEKYRKEIEESIKKEATVKTIQEEIKRLIQLILEIAQKLERYTIEDLSVASYCLKDAYRLKMQEAERHLLRFYPDRVIQILKEKWKDE